MYENETHDLILQRMLDRVSDELDKRESSLIWDTHSSTAFELQLLYIELETLIKDSYGDSATREFLILLCKDRGIEPEAATSAVLLGEFTPITVDVTGERFNIGELNYIVTEKISDGKYEVKCENAGIIGNQYLGSMIPMEYIDGLETANLTELLIPGEDEEDTEALRQRYFDSFKEQAFGGNRADYLAKVRSIDGVGDVKVTRVWNGDITPSLMIPNKVVQTWCEANLNSLPDGDVKTWLSAVYYAALYKKLTVGGTVLITLVDSDDFGEPSQVLIDLVQETLDPVQNAGEGYGLAPIGHVVNVKAANPITIDVTASITFEEGYNWSNLKTTITEQLNAYFLELRKKWSESTTTIVRISQIESKILTVQGVIDINNTKLNGVASNLILGTYDIPIVGGVSE